ncbi:MAG TPA: tellurite resistance TerB family protein [Hansschlegelia sp.]
MFDVKTILDQLVGAGANANQAGRPTGQPGRVPSTGGGPLGGAGDLMGQVQDLARGNLGGLAGGAIAGSLASVLLGGGRKGPQISGSAVKLGGLAILGGLAYKAWQNYQEKQAGAAGSPHPAPQSGPVQVAPPPAETPFTPSTAGEEQELGQMLVRAMIAAARSDGRIDGDEIAKIREGLKAAGAGGDEQTFLIEQLGKPDDLDGIAAQARGPELASEVWMAARLTIDADSPAEQAFLKTFADKLGLDAPLVAHLEATAAQARHSGVDAV